MIHLLALLSCLLVTGCQPPPPSRKARQLRKTYLEGPIPDGPLTLFIHGTKESVVSKLVHQMDFPLGIAPSLSVTSESILASIPVILDSVSPQEFPRASFYFFGWSGKLHFKSRDAAANRLYRIIKDHIGPLTIMAHSHGCNVVLLLADLAAEDPTSTLSVDQLVLLAPPVQVVTKHLVHSPIFKQVFTFYSTADLMQVCDPQGLYWESYACTPETTDVPLLSHRCYEPAPHIMQTRMMIDRQSLSHISFMINPFIKHLPYIMKMVKQRAEHGGYAQTRNFYTVNIRYDGDPEFLSNEDVARGYVPRSSYYKRRSAAKRARLQSASVGQPVTP